MDQKKTFRLELITQEKVLISEDVSYAVVPSESGPLGVLPRHAPLLGALAIGILKVRDTAKKEFNVFVDRGFFMISREGITLVVRKAEREDKIDVERAVAARERAKKLIASRNAGTDLKRANEAFQRAATRIKAAKGPIKN
jgi:F-type H+-transporting ATPase subunit epsilon